jgi:hypothetical protein
LQQHQKFKKEKKKKKKNSGAKAVGKRIRFFK